jgi:hypothetical protein
VGPRGQVVDNAILNGDGRGMVVTGGAAGEYRCVVSSLGIWALVSQEGILPRCRKDQGGMRGATEPHDEFLGVRARHRGNFIMTHRLAGVYVGGTSDPHMEGNVIANSGASGLVIEDDARGSRPSSSSERVARQIAVVEFP